MKNAEHINPLVNPVAPGDYVKCGAHVYYADTDIRGKWRVTRDGELVAQNIDGQVALCSWFDRVLGGVLHD